MKEISELWVAISVRGLGFTRKFEQRPSLMGTRRTGTFEEVGQSQRENKLGEGSSKYWKKADSAEGLKTGSKAW